MRVSCWMVCLHNPGLGLLHPNAVTRNAFGDPYMPRSVAAAEAGVDCTHDHNYGLTPAARLDWVAGV